MKKIIISLGLCACVGFTAMAQDMTTEEPTTSNNTALVNKRGVPILPSAGDFAIGIDANPFLRYAGNFFGKTNLNIAPNFGFDPITLYGKYFLTDNSAIRAKIGFDFGQDKDSETVRNDTEVANNPLNANATVVDYMTKKTNYVSLSVGYEMRRGYGRLQGFYGGEVFGSYGKDKTDYSYGNEMTALNQAPSSASWVANAANRPVEYVGGAKFGVGIGAFAGVEYFFAPKMSIGGEVGLGFSANKEGFGEATNESFDAAAGSIQKVTHRKNETGNNNFYLATGGQGRIFLMFHF